SLQSVEGSPRLIIARTLRMVPVDPHPGYAPGLVDDDRRRPGYAFLPELQITRILQAVGVDHLVLRIGKQRERDRSTPVSGDLLHEALALFVGVHADAPQRGLLARLEKGSQLGKLPSAVRSPVAAVEHQHYRSLAALGGKGVAPALLVFEREFGSDLARANRRAALLAGSGWLVGRCHGHRRDRAHSKHEPEDNFRDHGELGDFTRCWRIAAFNRAARPSRALRAVRCVTRSSR